MLQEPRHIVAFLILFGLSLLCSSVTEASGNDANLVSQQTLSSSTQLPPSDLPDGFWEWPTDEQLRWLQSRQAVLDMLKKFFETQRDIRDINKNQVNRAMMNGGNNASVPPLVTSAEWPVKHHAGSDSLPVVRRIFSRNGVGYADLIIDRFGERLVKAGDRLPDGTHVLKINADDVVVEIDQKQFSLPGHDISSHALPTSRLPVTATHPRPGGD